jgi:hypothetical protein
VTTKTRPRTVRFLSSKYPSFKMIRRSQGEIFMPNGNVANDPSKPEIAYKFERASLELREGQDILADKVDPVTGEIVEQDAIEWMRSQPDFNSVVFEVTPEPPPASEILQLVAAAAAAGDAETLDQLGQEEFETWGREDVLEVIKGALDTVNAKQKTE